MKKFKKNKQSAKSGQQEASSFVISEDMRSGGKLSWLKSKKLTMLMVIAVGVVLLGAGLFVLNRKDAPPKQPLSADIDRAYDTTELTNIPILLAYDYDLTVEKLESTNIIKKLNTYQDARNVSTALVRLKKQDKAMEVYKHIDAKFGNEAGYDFYTEYCGTAYRTGDKSLSSQMCDKAIEKAGRLELNDVEKKAIINSIKYSRDTLEEQMRNE